MPAAPPPIPALQPWLRGYIAAQHRALDSVSLADVERLIAAVRAVGPAAWLATQMAQPRGERAWDWMQANGYAAIDQRAHASSVGQDQGGVGADRRQAGRHRRARLAGVETRA